MLILPAIDLLEGRCVRLRRGSFDEPTVYSEDPAAVARGFVEAGAEALHLVDLEGARLGKAKNLEWIYGIRAELPVFLQVGGGIRTFALAARLFKAGIDRIVLGTAAAEDPALFQKLLGRFGSERVAAGLDTRAGRLAIRGWEAESGRSPELVVSELRELGLQHVVCTDVTRDGTLAGPGHTLAEQLVHEGFSVIVAGGIASLEDVRTVQRLGAAGCIIGSALYEGVLSLPEVLEAARAD